MKKNRAKGSDMRKIFWYIVFGIIGTILTIILYESISKIIPSGGTLLGIPFNWAWFTFALVMLFFTVIIYLFFRKNKTKIDNKRRL